MGWTQVISDLETVSTESSNQKAKRTKTIKARTAYLRTVGQLQKVYHTSHGNTEGEERKE